MAWQKLRHVGTIAAFGLAAFLLVVPTLVSAEAEGQPPGFVLSDDTWFGEQWSLFSWGQTVGTRVETTPDIDVRAPEAWSVTKGDPNVIVAVLDSGVDGAHPDLTDNLWVNEGEFGGGRESNGIDDDGNGFVDDWRGWDFVDLDNDPSDTRGLGQSGELAVAHGTSLASIIAADDNDWGMVGLAPDITVMAVRTPFSGTQLANALQYAIDNGATIINMSFGNFVPLFDAGFQQMHEVMLANPNVLYVAAAMNAGWDQDELTGKPCAYPDVPTLICVAATDEQDQLATFFDGSSGFGIETVALAAPGDNILVAQPALATIFADDFEDPDLTNWTSGGEWARSDDYASGGSGSVGITADQLTNTEAGYMVTVTTALDVSDVADCRFSGSVMVDVDRAARLLLEWNQPRVSDFWIPSAGLGGLGAIADTDGEWQPFDVTVPKALLRDGNLLFRFTLQRQGQSDPTGRGAFVDDLNFNCQRAGSEYTERNAFAYAEGTSYATPLVAATAGLVWSAYPDLTPLEVKQAIVTSAHPVDGLEELVTSGGRLDAYAALMAAELLAAANSGSGGLLSGLELPATPLEPAQFRVGGVPPAGPSPDPNPNPGGGGQQQPQPEGEPTPEPEEDPEGATGRPQVGPIGPPNPDWWRNWWFGLVGPGMAAATWWAVKGREERLIISVGALALALGVGAAIALVTGTSILVGSTVLGGIVLVGVGAALLGRPSLRTGDVEV